MDNWNTRQHNSSGLVQRVRESVVTEAEASAKTIEFLRKYVPAGKSPMCGNSICQDRRFLYRNMPELERYFHYRLLDVSTLKELALRWAPRIYNGHQKEPKHLALSDIRDSIEELKYYLHCIPRLIENVVKSTGVHGRCSIQLWTRSMVNY